MYTIDTDVALLDGSHHSNGRLEVCVNGTWGRVCDNYWSEVESQVACRELGYTGE